MFLVFILWIALLPFISFAGSFEGPKVVWFWSGGLLLTLYHAVLVWQKKMHGTDGTLLVFSAWVAVLSISSFLGIHPIESFLGGSYRHQGVLFFFTLILVSKMSRQISSAHINNLNALGIGAGILESCIVLYQSFFLHMPRPIGTLGEPNAVAGFLALSMFWVLRGKSLPAVVQIFSIALLSSCVLLTQSRAGIVMIVVILVINGVSELMREGRSAIKIGVIAGIVCCAILVGLVQYKSITTIRGVSQFENRSLFYRVGIEEFMKKPLLGYGAESGEVVYDLHFSRISMPLADYMIDRSHNVFLDVALWSGSIGLLIFVSWLVYSVYDIYKIQDFLRLSFIVGWVVFACVQPVGVVHWVHLILLLYIPVYKHEK